MIAYKGFEPGLVCRNYQFQMGLNVTDKANCRQNGFHCAEDPLDCLNYYGDMENSEYWLVDAGGDVNEDGDDSKISCTELTIIKQLTKMEFFIHALAFMVDHPKREWSSRVVKDKANAYRGYAVVRGRDPVFVYDSDSRLKVLPAFIREIQSNGLVKPEGIYKAVGMFENVSGLKISDYWPAFQKKVRNKSKTHFSDFVMEISSALTNGDLFLAERLVRKLLSKILHYSGIDDAEGKSYGSISVKRYISRNFSQKYQTAILGLSQYDDFAYSAVEGKIKEILTELLGDGWLENIPAPFMQLSPVPQAIDDNNHIYVDECCIPIVFDTVYGVKGETHDATLYLETETKQNSDIRRILPLLERKRGHCKNELQEKSRRCVYVGFSRPKYLLALAISEKTYVGHETAFSSWKIVDLRSEAVT